MKLVDAGFLWTEPHSRRIKLQLKVQASVLNGAILEQTFVVEFVVETQMCLECTRAAGTNTNVWTACAQVAPSPLPSRQPAPSDLTAPSRPQLWLYDLQPADMLMFIAAV